MGKEKDCVWCIHSSYGNFLWTFLFIHRLCQGFGMFNLIFITQNYTVLCRLRWVLVLGGRRNSWNISYSWVTVTTIPIYWDDISSVKVQVFRDLIKTTRKFFSHKGISFFLSNTFVSYMISPFVIQDHFDLLLLSGKSDFYKIMGILSPCLSKNTSVWRLQLCRNSGQKPLE